MKDLFCESLFKRLRARHEVFNGRLRIFAVLDSVFSQEKNKHYVFFHAVANIVLMSLNFGAELFEI